MPQSVRGNALNPGTLARRGKTFLDFTDTLIGTLEGLTFDEARRIAVNVA
jgi:hypothetical protein